jgi:hypothetical protein
MPEMYLWTWAQAQDDPADDFLHQVFKWHAAKLTISGERAQTLHRLKNR